MTEDERNKCGTDQLLSFAHFTWSAKEAMFKAYKIGNVDFKAHLFPDIPTNNIDNNYFECTGFLKNNLTHLEFRLFCWKHLDFYIVFALKM
jgi:phosphopantetheinyl transferase (holo-ACP synthase)